MILTNVHVCVKCLLCTGHAGKECGLPRLWPRGKSTAVTVRSPGVLSRLVQLVAECFRAGHLSKKMKRNSHCSACEWAVCSVSSRVFIDHSLGVGHCPGF